MAVRSLKPKRFRTKAARMNAMINHSRYVTLAIINHLFLFGKHLCADGFQFVLLFLTFIFWGDLI